MTPYRSFFKGTSVTYMNPNLSQLKENDPYYAEWKGCKKLYLTTLAIISLIPLTLLAIVCKTLNYCISAETRENYRSLAFGTQFTKWKDGFHQNPSVELKDDKSEIRLPDDFDFQQKFNQIPEEKRSYLSTFSPSSSEEEMSSLAEKIGDDREHGVLLLWWLGTNGLITDPKQLYSLTKKTLTFFNNEQLDELRELYKKTSCDNFYFELAIFDLIPEPNKLLVLESVFKNKKESFNIIVDGKELYRAPSSIYQIQFSSSLFSKIVTKLSQPRRERVHSSFLKGWFHSSFLIVGLQLMESNFIKKIDEFENMPFENRRLYKEMHLCQRTHLFNYIDYFNVIDYFITNKINLKDVYIFLEDKLNERWGFNNEYVFAILARAIENCNPKTLPVFFSILSKSQLCSLIGDGEDWDDKTYNKMLKNLPINRHFLDELFRFPEMRTARALANMPVPALRYFFSDLDQYHLSDLRGFVRYQDEKQLCHVLPFVVPVIPLEVIYEVWKQMVWDIEDWYFSWIGNEKNALKNIFSLASFNKWKSTMKSEEEYEKEAYIKVIPDLEFFDTKRQQRVLAYFKKYCVLVESFFSYRPFRTLMWEKTKDTKENQSSKEDKRTLAKALSFFNMPTLKRLCLEAVLGNKTSYAGLVPEEVEEELEYLAGLKTPDFERCIKVDPNVKN